MSRIVFFVNSMEVGGAERVAAQLCNYWAENGSPVRLVITYSQGGEIRYPLSPEVEVEFVAETVGTRTRTAVTALRRLIAMRRSISRFKADVVVSFLPRINVAAILVSFGLGVKVLVSERAYPPAVPLGRVWHLLRRMSYPYADSVVMQTSAGLDWLNDEIPGARGSVVPNPCVYPLERGSPVIEPSDLVSRERRILLASGRFEEQKGFSGLIRVFANLAAGFADWDLVILGEGRQREALEQQVMNAGLEQRVFLPGNIGNPGDWYDRASVFVLSSSFEGFPNALVEALAYGVPAVSFDCLTGPAEIIHHGKNGILVPPHAGFEGLESELRRMMANPEWRHELAREAVRVRDRYGVSRIAHEWLSLAGEASGNPSSAGERK